MTTPDHSAVDAALAAYEQAVASGDASLIAQVADLQAQVVAETTKDQQDEATIATLQAQIAQLQAELGASNPPASMQFGIDVTNQQESGVSYSTRAAYGRGKVGGSCGPHSKWFDGSSGPSTAVSHLVSSGYGTVAGETDPVICFKRLNSSDQSFLKARANALTTDEYWCFWQEPEDNIKTGNPTISDFDNAYNTLDAIRKSAKGGSHVKLWPCLMNYQEHDVDKAGFDWKAILTPIKDVIDGFGADFYRSASNSASQTPAIKGGWILDCSQTLQKPWSCTEFGVQVSTKIGETKQQAAQWQADCLAWFRSNGCQWVNLWLDGVWDDDTVNAPFFNALKVQNMLLGTATN